jgi:hypothetical protein
MSMKKPPMKKATPKKTATKKAATKKAATKKAATKKAATKKAATKKAVPKKAVPKKAATKKAVPKKAATKKAVTKKAGTPRVRVRGTRHDPPVLLLVHLPISLTPAERAEQFEGPLEMALAELGTITGAGTALDENGEPRSCDIEVEVNDVARALPIVRRVLVEGGAARGTLIARMAAAADNDVEVLFEL